MSYGQYIYIYSSGPTLGYPCARAEINPIKSSKTR